MAGDDLQLPPRGSKVRIIRQLASSHCKNRLSQCSRRFSEMPYLLTTEDIQNSSRSFSFQTAAYCLPKSIYRTALLLAH